MLRWDDRNTRAPIPGLTSAMPVAAVQTKLRLICALGALTLAALVSLSMTPAAAQTKSANINVSINGANVKGVSEPLKLDASAPQHFKISVNNSSSAEVHVAIVSFEGKVVGLPVFRCEGLVSLVVPPGGAADQEFEMDSNCLKDQATGLMPAKITVYDQNRAMLDSWNLTLDISGSLKSIYGLFGIALAALTVLSILGGLISLARHRLSPNRWSRAMRFAIPGIGLGFTIVFALAAAGIAVPTATMWIPVVGASFAALGLFGYFSPKPDEPEDFASSPQPATLAGDTVVMPPGAAVTSPMPQAAQPYYDPGQTQAAQQPPVAPPPVEPSVPPPSQTVRRIAPEEQAGE
ncbi:MAG: hypothetical protein DCC49_11490 [Acidobacteria bacterium]|nr:MAG: hypothetical protein DCC49_11490 [Acidobacteriota bacterium]